MGTFFHNSRKLVILDDDPTGMQTVHGCLALTRWAEEDIQAALNDEVPFFFILTNTRALPAGEAVLAVKSAVTNVIRAARNTRADVCFLFRSDSTLRGHFPLELDTIAETSGMPVDARFFIPAFFEGDRITEHNIHYIRNGETLTPCHETEFANDSVFGYSSAFLPDYIQEKSRGKIQSDSVISIPRKMLDGSHDRELLETILQLECDRYVIVNCINYQELHRFFEVLRYAMDQGKHVLFQTAASSVKSLTQCPDQEYMTLQNSEAGPGLIFVGSHVAKTSAQLKILLQEGIDIEAVEIDVISLLNDENAYIKQIVTQATEGFKHGRTPVIYTSREEIPFLSIHERLMAGKKISAFLTHIVRLFTEIPAFVIAKGGITSHDILAKGLEVSSARVLGQAAAGIPVLKMPHNHRWPGMPYVIFPGNVGGNGTLLEVYQSIHREL